jgi:hypothetical protein
MPLEPLVIWLLLLLTAVMVLSLHERAGDMPLGVLVERSAR